MSKHEWSVTPDGLVGRFCYKHNPMSRSVVVRQEGGSDSPEYLLHIDAEIMVYLLRQLAERYGPEEVFKWITTTSSSPP